MSQLVERNLFERIRQQYGDLSASFRKVADFIVENYRDAAFLPAAKLAYQAGVSESVVIRFAIYLGYSGFPEMIREVQRYVKAQLSPEVKLEVSAQDLGDMTPDQVLQATLEQDVQNLLETGRDLANNDFPAAVEMICGAERLYVVGLRGLSNLAGLMVFLLDVAGTQAALVDNADSRMFQHLRHIGPRDVLVVFAFHRYTVRSVDAVRLAKSKGARVVVIADAITAPAAQDADLVLRSAARSHAFFNSYVGAISLVNALVTCCTLRHKDRAEASMKELETLIPESDFVSS